MNAWTCPNCDGGFPQPIKWQGKYVCPWCYEELAEHHDSADHVIEEAMKPTVVSHVKKDDDDEHKSPIRRLLE